MSTPLSDESAAPALGADPAALQKSTLVLHYDDDGIGLEKRLFFEAATPAAALEIAAGEAAGRHARLFVDGRPLCSVVKADEDHPFWVIAASAGRPIYAPTPTSLPEDLP